MKPLSKLIILATIMIVAIGLLSCGLSNQSSNSEDDIYQVYSATLTELFAQEQQGRPLYISDETNSQSLPSKLEHRFDIPFPYELADGAKVNEDFEKLESAQLVQKYPNFSGLVTLSPVEFQPGGTASVRVEFTWCPLCGFGTTVYLKKDLLGWTVVRQEGGWVS
jgi:hypothetical protein